MHAAERGRKDRRMTPRPNVLVILTDQLRYPPPYESAELAAFRREHLSGVERLRQNGVWSRHHYSTIKQPITCRPSSPRSTSAASGTWSSSPATTTTRSSGPLPASG